jgi:hypothetical protein
MDATTNITGKMFTYERIKNWYAALWGVVAAAGNYQLNIWNLNVLNWIEIFSKGITALIVGGMGAAGGVVGKLLINYLRKKIPTVWLKIKSIKPRFVMNFFKKPFVVGMALALSVVLTDFLNAYIVGNDFNFQALILAGGIALAGYIGKFLTGTGNTNLALLGSSLVAIIPMVTGGSGIDWKLVAAAFAVKFLGLITQGAGMADVKPKQP